MPRHASTKLITLEWLALIAAAGVAAWRAQDGNWDLPLLATLLVLSISSDLLRIGVRAHRMFVSASFLAIITAAVFLGEVPAALIGVTTIVAVWLKERYPRDYLLINLVTYAWFPLIVGIAFHELVDAGGISDSDPVFYLLVLAVFVVGLIIDFTAIAAYTCWEEGSRFATKVRRTLVPILPSELAAAVLTVAIAVAYVQLGLAALAMFGAVILVFQYLVGALLVSQERADELELRAKQLAGFQVALLSALVRTLDLRDRMTARHSAAVARYSREIAAKAGLSGDQQDLVHTAALLHDIGKFVLPDAILKSSRARPTDQQWAEILRHPSEGARIVSQIDGYQPIGEIILAHHERIDGKGYPRALSGDEIPVLARVIAVADAYDVMTARDSYRDPLSPSEAENELRRVAGTQLDERFVEAFIEVLDGKDLAYRHGQDADFEAELALDKRIHEYSGAPASPIDDRSRSLSAADTGQDGDGPRPLAGFDSERSDRINPYH
ncbi:MAG: HD-GYP domain-containing protein [Solirubrobacterales bacterium]